MASEITGKFEDALLELAMTFESGEKAGQWIYIHAIPPEEDDRTTFPNNGSVQVFNSRPKLSFGGDDYPDVRDEFPLLRKQWELIEQVMSLCGNSFESVRLRRREGSLYWKFYLK